MTNVVSVAPIHKCPMMQKTLIAADLDIRKRKHNKIPHNICEHHACQSIKKVILRRWNSHHQNTEMSIDSVHTDAKLEFTSRENPDID